MRRVLAWLIVTFPVWGLLGAVLWRLGWDEFSAELWYGLGRPLAIAAAFLVPLALFGWALAWALKQIAPEREHKPTMSDV